MAIETDQQADAADIKAAVMKAIEVMVVDPSQEVDTTTGVWYPTIPSSVNGYNLVRAQAIIPGNGTAGVTNATTIQVRNMTKYPSNDALSSPISIASGAKVGTPGTVNTSYDDVSTDDELKIYVTAQSTTKPKGLKVILEFKLP